MGCGTSVPATPPTTPQNLGTSVPRLDSATASSATRVAEPSITSTTVSPPVAQNPTEDNCTPLLVARKRRSLFEASDVEADVADNSSAHAVMLDDSTKSLLVRALAVHFAVDQQSADYLKLEIFASCMKREEFDGGVTVLAEGTELAKLYIIEYGYVQITVKSAFIKTVGKGSVLGELLLKEDEVTRPLQSTAHCITKTVLWSLTKEDVRKAEFTSSSELLLRGALFEYFGVEQYAAEMDKIDVFVKSMVREEIPGATTLIKEGEVGNKLYIIDSGFYQISVKGQYVRTLGRGKVLGDLALLYDAPRSASAHSITDSVVWSLHRDTFRQINIRSSSTAFKRRAKWLISCPELASLNVVNFTRLINTFQSKDVDVGTALYTARTLASDCMVIESGRAVVYVPSESMIAGRSPAEIDAFLGICRPVQQRRLSRDLVDFINGAGNVSMDDAESDHQSVTIRSVNSANLDSSDVQLAFKSDTVDSRADGGDEPDGVYACEVYEGCIIGTGALRVETPDTEVNNAWKSSNRSWKFENGSWHALRTGYGSQAPFTVRCIEKVKVCAFSFETYERLLEAPDPIQIEEFEENHSEKSQNLTLRSSETNDGSKSNSKGVFDISMFTANYVLGKGSFGVVLFATLKPGSSLDNNVAIDPQNTPPKGFALKIYDKKDVANNSQLKNVIQGSHLLRKMNSPFVMKLYGTFQTLHQLYMVLEPLLHGSIWDVMTSGPFFKLGLPPPLVKFYISSILLGLVHVHSHGASYRELKPENVMLDSGGNIRLIDFGMCKRIPYTKTDSRGNVKVYSKSYTLFGTPEYLSPEQVFNLGHDYGVDIWAVGILLYEMILGVTPFAPKKPDNLTELFANIATAKKSGPPMPPLLQEKAKDSRVLDLILRLLEYDAADRIGVKEGATPVIFSHPYFEGFDVQSLKNNTMMPPFYPSASQYSEPLFNLPGVKRYRGDQRMFDAF